MVPFFDDFFAPPLILLEPFLEPLLEPFLDAFLEPFLDAFLEPFLDAFLAPPFVSNKLLIVLIPDFNVSPATANKDLLSVVTEVVELALEFKSGIFEDVADMLDDVDDNSFVLILGCSEDVASEDFFSGIEGINNSLGTDTLAGDELSIEVADKLFTKVFA